MSNYTESTMNNTVRPIFSPEPEQGLHASTIESRPRLLKVKEVASWTKLSVSHIYTLSRQDLFPKPRKLTANSSVWLESDIVEWMNDRLGLNG
ncbi:AlpA family phage regulatory protein [Thiomicrospira microaerophila]|uniref:helix-turn-helix transcriptional regulator n=1 Tax=Thiomicrospira microaerophila TaxID=406020 RepID=UPI002010C274|nr:AlpA family phage regulatory protein [Thiomicrospira microaerophila]UQB42754.1 AlpA family phage regulatory protein [Thiomicrospira microaerophila]